MLIDALTALSQRYRRIPSCLKSWCIWYPSKFTTRKDGVSLGKPPCNRQGKPTGHDKSNWMSFDEAVGLDMDGVGIMLHEELVLTGIDFDHCVNDGVIIDPWVAQKVKELNSYTEYSVSGTGIHVLVWGRLPWNKCNSAKIEMYDGSRSRFLLITGNHVPGTPTEIRDAQDTIDAIHLEVFGAGPDGLVEQISRKTALQQNQQVSPNPNTSYSQERGGKGKGGNSPRFEIRPDAQLSIEDQARLNELMDKLPKFKSTWKVARATSPWPFKSGRNSPSEYEGALAFFLVWDGWAVQEVMNAICVWRRECGLAPRTEYCRYACTIGKAFAMVTPRSKGLGGTRKESKGLYRHGYTRDQILGSIIATPRTPKQIAEYTGIVIATVYVVLGRLAKDRKVIRAQHTYLCAPHAVPSYLQNIPDDADEPTSEELEEYAEWVADGMPGLGAVEEEIEAPMMATRPAAASRMAPLPSFDDLELEPELVTVEPALRVAELTWSSDRPGGKRTHYTMAALKREAKAKRLGRPQWVPDRFQADMERVEAQFALDQAAGKIDEGLFV